VFNVAHLTNIKTLIKTVTGVILHVINAQALHNSNVNYVMSAIISTETFVIKIYVQDRHTLLIMIVEYVSHVNGDVKYVEVRIIVRYVHLVSICFKDGAILNVQKILIRI
jgi:hypothetical protein